MATILLTSSSPKWEKEYFGGCWSLVTSRWSCSWANCRSRHCWIFWPGRSRSRMPSQWSAKCGTDRYWTWPICSAPCFWTYAHKCTGTTSLNSYRGIDLVQKRLQLDILEVGAGEDDHLVEAFLVVEVVPELTLEVLEPCLKVVFGIGQFDLIKVLFDLAIQL